MSVKKQKNVKIYDVIGVLNQYKREHNVVAYKRTKYAIKALSSYFTNHDVREIDIPLCRQYTAHRMGEGVSISTVARELSCLRAAVNHARKWRRLKSHEMPVFEIPSGLPIRETWLLRDELKQILSVADPEMQAFIRLCYETGSRKTAIEKLEWDQVNFSRKTINLAKPNEPKTNKRRPTVPFGNLQSILQELYHNRQNCFVLGSERNRSYDFEKTCKLANLLNVEEKDGRPAGKITPHILRHTRATHLLEDGVSIYSVAKLLGDNPMTIQRTYGHISMSSLENELAKSPCL